MMMVDRLKRRLKQLAIKTTRYFEEKRLIVVVGVLEILFKEPMLNRSQRQISRQNFLFGGRIHRESGHGRKFPHGLIFKQQRGCKFKALASGECDHLDAQNRVSTELKEIVVDADFFDPEHL